MDRFGKLKREQLEGLYEDIVLANLNRVFLIARAYPEEGSYEYVVVIKNYQNELSYKTLDTAIEMFNEAVKRN